MADSTEVENFADDSRDSQEESDRTSKREILFERYEAGSQEDLITFARDINLLRTETYRQILDQYREDEEDIDDESVQRNIARRIFGQFNPAYERIVGDVQRESVTVDRRLSNEEIRFKAFNRTFDLFFKRNLLEQKSELLEEGQVAREFIDTVAAFTVSSEDERAPHMRPGVKTALEGIEDILSNSSTWNSEKMAEELRAWLAQDRSQQQGIEGYINTVDQEMQELGTVQESGDRTADELKAVLDNFSSGLDRYSQMFSDFNTQIGDFNDDYAEVSGLDLTVEDNANRLVDFFDTKYLNFVRALLARLSKRRGELSAELSEANAQINRVEVDLSLLEQFGVDATTVIDILNHAFDGLKVERSETGELAISIAGFDDGFRFPTSDPNSPVSKLSGAIEYFKSPQHFSDIEAVSSELEVLSGDSISAKEGLLDIDAEMPLSEKIAKAKAWQSEIKRRGTRGVRPNKEAFGESISKEQEEAAGMLVDNYKKRKELADKLINLMKVPIEYMELVGKVDVKIEGVDISEALKDFKRVNINNPDFKTSDALNIWSKYLSQVNSTRVLKRLRNDLSDKKKQVSKVCNMTDAEFGQRVLEAVVEWKRPGISLEERDKEVETRLIKDNLEAVTDKTKLELAQRATAEEVDLVNQFGELHVAERLTQFKFEQGGSVVEPFKGMSTADFSDFSRLKKKMGIEPGKPVNVDTVFYVLAAYAEFQGDTGVPSLQYHRLEEEAKKMLTLAPRNTDGVKGGLGMQMEYLTNAGNAAMLEEAFKQRLADARALMRNHFEAIDDTTTERRDGEEQYFKAKKERIMIMRRLGPKNGGWSNVKVLYEERKLDREAQDACFDLAGLDDIYVGFLGASNYSSHGEEVLKQTGVVAAEGAGRVLLEGAGIGIKSALSLAKLTGAGTLKALAWPFGLKNKLPYQMSNLVSNDVTRVVGYGKEVFPRTFGRTGAIFKSGWERGKNWHGSKIERMKNRVKELDEVMKEHKEGEMKFEPVKNEGAPFRPLKPVFDKIDMLSKKAGEIAKKGGEAASVDNGDQPTKKAS